MGLFDASSGELCSFPQGVDPSSTSRGIPSLLPAFGSSRLAIDRRIASLRPRGYRRPVPQHSHSAPRGLPVLPNQSQIDRSRRRSGDVAPGPAVEGPGRSSRITKVGNSPSANGEQIGSDLYVVTSARSAGVPAGIRPATRCPTSAGASADHLAGTRLPINAPQCFRRRISSCPGHAPSPSRSSQSCSSRAATRRHPTSRTRASRRRRRLPHLSLQS